MPDVVTSPEAQPLRVDVTLDEMEQGVKAAEKADKEAAEQAAAEVARKKAAEDAKGAADDPKVSALKEALRLSEESRQRLERSLAEPRSPEPPPAPVEKELTKEELAELHSKDPVAAIEYMQARAIKTVEENLTRRMQPLMTGNASTLEEQMKAKYPDEFKLFGPEISEFVSKADKSVFSVAKNWEDLIAWTRGKNVDKLLDYRIEQRRLKDAGDAQAAQAAAAGTHVGSTVRTPQAAPSAGAFDDTTKAIIKELAASGVLDEKDPEGDYRKWLATGR